MTEGTAAIAHGWRRRSVAGMAALLGMACAASAAQAGDAWPRDPLMSPEWLARDTEGGLAILPLVCWWAWIAAWSSTSGWLFRDSTRLKIPSEFWTSFAIIPFVFFSLLAWWIPSAAVGQALMALAWLVPLFVYSRERNRAVPAAESILTSAHLRRLISGLLSSRGSKGPKVVEDVLPFVKLLATAAETPEDNQKWQQEAAAMPGFAAATKLIAEAAAARASMLAIEVTADGLRVRHDVDSIVGPARFMKTRATLKQPEVWADAPPPDVTIGGSALTVLRTIAGADAAKLSGEKDASFTIEVDGKKRRCRLVTRATKTAKQIAVTFETPPLAPAKLEELGMSAAMAGRVRELIALEKGLFLVSSPPAAGSSTTFDTVLLSADRLLRDFVSIEDSGTPHTDVQNVKPVKYSAAAGETPLSALKAALLEYPRAIVTRDLTDKQLAVALLQLADEQQLVFVSMRANGALDAVAKLLAFGIEKEQLARCLLGSLSQRLIRKLCLKCGEPIPPPPELLQRLKTTAEQLPEIKRASQQGGCQACAGRQYVGRTAIFELATGPTLRQAISKLVDPKVLLQAAVKDGMRPLFEAGLAAVAAGVTSLDERQRVFVVNKEAGAPGVKR